VIADREVNPANCMFCGGKAKRIFEKVGEMPEIFFLYYEEMDWCTQMTNAGYELWYVSFRCV